MKSYLEDLNFSPEVGKDSFIPENIFYRLAMKAKNETAEKFQALVADEIIPSIRRTGMYKAPTGKELLALAVIEAQKTIEEQNRIIEEQKPKVEFFDAVTDSKDAIPMADVAKVLDMGMGRNKLFRFLRKNKILTADNKPYQRYVDAGYFRVVEQRYDKGYGETGINVKTLVFQKGVDFIRKKLESNTMESEWQKG